MDVSYDRKFRWLVVEVEDSELGDMAEKICTESGHQEYLGYSINGVYYRRNSKRPSASKVKTLAGMLTAIGGWLLMLILSGLGAWKLIELAGHLL